MTISKGKPTGFDDQDVLNDATTNEVAKKYRCLVCENVWTTDQIHVDGRNKTCGDAFCGANVRLVE